MIWAKRKRVIDLVMKIYLPIVVGGFLVVHWWWSALHPYIKSNILEFFISHLLIVIGIWFVGKKTRQGRKVTIICGLFFVIYGFFMATLLIPGGFEEIGIFAIAVPVYLAVLGVVLLSGLFFRRK